MSDVSDTEYTQQQPVVQEAGLRQPAPYTGGHGAELGGLKPGGTPTICCPHCDKRFMRGYNMRVHIDRVHNKVKLYVKVASTLQGGLIPFPRFLGVKGIWNIDRTNYEVFIKSANF